MAAHIEAGTVFMNRCDYLDPALPWTGYKLSGRGTGLSHHAFHGLTERKAIHFKLPSE
jgi:acyl-CoA reductase-like NAD-dependent aldehyde dehydrogenase